MRDEDVPAVFELSVECFEDLARRRGQPPETRPRLEDVHLRYQRVLETDPGGAWVTEDDGTIAAGALAILREGVWGLSLLVVRPALQSAGLGREVLARAHDYADGARGRIILASPDERALRAYARLGLDAHPALRANGTPRGVPPPPDVRAGGPEDIPFTEVVDRRVRGAAHGGDIATLLAMGAELLIAPERGYAVVRDGGVRLLAAVDAAGAADVLRGALARTGEGQASVEWITSHQQWALRVCVDAGLRISTDIGAVFLGGDVGPFTPYLPSGAFL